MKEKGVAFSDIKKKLVDAKHEGAEDMESVNDIQNVKIFEIIIELNIYKI